MSKELLGRYSEVAIFLEAVGQEVLDNRGGTFWYRRTVILNDAEQGRHWVKEVVGRLSLQQFNDGTAYGPNIRSCGRARLFNHLRRH